MVFFNWLESVDSEILDCIERVLKIPVLDRMLGNATVFVRVGETIPALKPSNNDFIARYGGDEFFIVVDTGSRRVLEEIIRRIQRCLEKLNASEELNRPVSLSMGYDLYNPKSGQSVEEFQKSIDTRMYEIKRRSKSAPPRRTHGGI